MRIYITGVETENEDKLDQVLKATHWLKLNGHQVIDPQKLPYVLPLAMTQQELMEIKFKLIELCDCIYMLKGWQSSPTAKFELAFAKGIGKKVKYEDKQWKYRQMTAGENDDTDVTV